MYSLRILTLRCVRMRMKGVNTNVYGVEKRRVQCYPEVRRGNKMQEVEGTGGVSSSPCLFTVQESWQQTPDARGYINSLLKRNKRTHFGNWDR